MTDPIFPQQTWQSITPAEAGFNPEKLAGAKTWLDDHIGDRPYRLVIVRGGRLVVEWNHQTGRETRYGIASAAKSIYSNVLGIVVAEGKLPTADANVVDYYPEMMDVPEGEGPKEGRYAFEKDRAITFRQLICNTSGYMKPGEEPGQVFHYQTYGMNILTHSLAKIYGLYDIADPEGAPGFKKLVKEKIANPIGANWAYGLKNFPLHDKARLNIFGYYCEIQTNALDFARVGWLWRNRGRWGGKQVIPEAWIRETTVTNPDILAHGSDDQRQYGHGFWVNDHGLLWPDMPRDGFTASGAGGHYCSVFPGLDLVIVQNPGPYIRTPEGFAARGNPDLLKLILGAIEDR
jgi:CubicO group peptidase (beta-lactamase class C family)